LICNFVCIDELFSTLETTTNMPNWFTGTVFFEGDEEKMKPIVEWANQYDEDSDNCKPFNSLLPLPSMGDTFDDDKWDFHEAVGNWGSKWGVCNPTCVNIDDKTVQFCFKSAWNMPHTMFWSIEKKYGVLCRASGSECGWGFVSMFHDGQLASGDIDYLDFPLWYAKNIEKCDVSTLPPFDADTDIWEWNDGCLDDLKSEWIEYLTDSLEKELEEFNPS